MFTLFIRFIPDLNNTDGNKVLNLTEGVCLCACEVKIKALHMLHLIALHMSNNNLWTNGRNGNMIQVRNSQE